MTTFPLFWLRMGLNQKVQKIEWCRKVDQNSSKCKKWGGRCALSISDLLFHSVSRLMVGWAGACFWIQNVSFFLLFLWISREMNSEGDFLQKNSTASHNDVKMRQKSQNSAASSQTATTAAVSNYNILWYIVNYLEWLQRIMIGQGHIK